MQHLDRHKQRLVHKHRTLFFSIRPPGLPLKIANGCSISPDAVTVTATVALMVCDGEVLPFMVLAPARMLLVTRIIERRNNIATQTPYLLG